MDGRAPVMIPLTLLSKYDVKQSSGGQLKDVQVLEDPTRKFLLDPIIFNDFNWLFSMILLY